MGSCKNYKKSTGCQNNFKDMQCKNCIDYYCYKEQQLPYGDDGGNNILLYILNQKKYNKLDIHPI